jgi:hypothetical protein
MGGYTGEDALILPYEQWRAHSRAPLRMEELIFFTDPKGFDWSVALPPHP